MPINPKVIEYLKVGDNEEGKLLIFGAFRYDSKTGKGLADAISYERETGDLIGKNFPRGFGTVPGVNVVEAIIELCPNFERDWLAYSKNLKPDEKTFTHLLTKFAQYVVKQFRSGRTEKFKTIFLIVEAALLSGEEYVQNWVCTAFLEDLQNIAGNYDIDPEVFKQYLGPEATKWWNEIYRFWTDLEYYL